MKKKLLIVNSAQFGYHLDTYYYCKHLKDSYDITYIGWDYSNEKIEEDSVKVIDVKRTGNNIIRTARLIKQTLNEIKQNRPDIVFIKYFRGCSFLNILAPKTTFLFDIRTSIWSVWYFNSLMKFESLLFRNITIISESLREWLKYPKNKCDILPLGADSITIIPKEFNQLHLVYVGMFTDRYIDHTIKGLAKFHQKHSDTKVHYTIIGKGRKNELAEYQELTKKLGIEKLITFTGFVHHANIKEYFDNANVGVSYVPITPYFDVQPPTKTFEYLLSGMPVIATNTYENRIVMNDDNGVLIQDNPEDFCKGLESIYEKFQSDHYSSKSIIEMSQQYSWHHVTKVLDDIIQRKISGK